MFPKPSDQWENDVWLMAKRMALLYMEMAKAIIERLGPDEGKKLIKEAVWKYGEICGRNVREKVLAKGLPLTAQNFSLVPDLPSKGWRGTESKDAEGKGEHRVTFCPLAVVWKENGVEQLGRLYCYVDQAKFHAYNPELECVHVKNVLDGDRYCVIDVRKRT